MILPVALFCLLFLCTVTRPLPLGWWLVSMGGTAIGGLVLNLCHMPSPTGVLAVCLIVYNLCALMAYRKRRK